MTEHPNGSFASVEMSKTSTDQLLDWAYKNNIADPINHYHITVLFSTIGVPEARNEPIPLPIQTVITGWEVFPTRFGTNCLVGRVDEAPFRAINDHFRTKYGANHMYPDYKAHVSITYDFGDSALPTSVPDFPLFFDQYVFDKLKSIIPQNKENEHE